MERAAFKFMVPRTDLLGVLMVHVVNGLARETTFVRLPMSIHSAPASGAVYIDKAGGKETHILVLRTRDQHGMLGVETRSADVDSWDDATGEWAEVLDIYESGGLAALPWASYEAVKRHGDSEYYSIRTGEKMGDGLHML